jgi:hypothetical protein
MLQVIREREKLYSLLRQITQQRLKPAADSKWSIDPRTRYITTAFPFHPVYYITAHRDYIVFRYCTELHRSGVATNVILYESARPT